MRIRTLILSLLAVLAIGAVASASASAVTTSFCYKANVAGKGNRDSSCITNAGATANDYINVTKLTEEKAAGVWCAEVFTAGTGEYSEGKCKVLGAPKDFIEVSAFNKVWEVCTKATGGLNVEPPAKYDEHKCNTQAKALVEREWEFQTLAAAESSKVVSEGGEFKLTVETKVITCKKVTDKGTITGGSPGTDLAAEIKFTECKTAQTGCLVKSAGQPNGTIVATNIPTVLVEREPGGGGAKKLADELKENATTKEFVTLKFEAEAGKSCSEYPETKVKGQVAAETVTGTGELNFPSPELKGNTLTAFGKAAKLTGKDTQAVVQAFTETVAEGWAVRAS
jgi:hypothetical protein